MVRVDGHANSTVKIRLSKIDHAPRSVNPQLKIGMTVMQLRQARQQPLLQERRNRRNIERADGAALP